MVELKQELNLNLGLILTHQLDLSLKILTLSVTELQEQINELIVCNPLIDIDSDYKDSIQNQFENKFKEIEQSYKVRFESEEEYDELDFFSEEKTLEQSLFEDLNLSYNLTQQELDIAKEIIHNIDENGFLCDYEIDKKFDYIRTLIMNLHPIGCASKNTQEFFHLQNNIIYKNELFFEDLEKFIDAVFTTGLDIKQLQKQNFSSKQIQFFIEKLRNFKPYPLYGYSKTKNTDFVYYDIEIKQIGSKFVPIINDEFLHKLTINEALVKHVDKDAFLKEKLREIKIIQDAINMRYKTLLKIANIVVEKQTSFFEKGLLQPLSMSQVALLAGYSISTISRAISNKYVLFESKLYPFKIFFSNESKNGVSKHRILELIKMSIAQEDPLNPLDDEALRQILAKNNIHVTRRAIAKYRKELKIPKSKDRKAIIIKNV